MYSVGNCVAYTDNEPQYFLNIKKNFFINLTAILILCISCNFYFHNNQ